MTSEILLKRFKILLKPLSFLIFKGVLKVQNLDLHNKPREKK